MDRNLTLEAVRLTEAAALYASRYMGKGDENTSYFSATEAMARVFSTIEIKGLIVIGSDEESSELIDGTFVGTGTGPELDLAVKPLDGKKTCAIGGYNALSVMAVGHRGSFFKTPKLYMEKIAVGKEAKGVVDITQPVDINIKRVARAKGKYIEDITVCLLDRERNNAHVQQIRKTGAKIKFIRDGDISGAISTALEDNAIDILMGIGGAKEGVLGAAALKCLDGDMQARYIYQNESERTLIRDLGEDPDRIFSISDMVTGDDIMVSATGVTDGLILPGVRYFSGGAKTNSIVIRHKTHTLRTVQAIHHFDYKPIF
ncbi:MAG TPA: class II fructose-bisphosphatase [Spirochaetota bacterium]|nr:class II fructose-bisphosphatase [Spirochaetota bacterium]HPI90803.1 class II fructose-bisphosphatase [Spirochaetota bacterium]HPR47616.1 class II fructose-bisphosphatase [Spirochaetota bacterium]